MRKIEGTVKFEVYMYRGRAVRKNETRKPEHFVYRQWGRVMLKDENDRTVKNKAITDFGELTTFINRTMREQVMKDLNKSR